MYSRFSIIKGLGKTKQGFIEIIVYIPCSGLGNEQIEKYNKVYHKFIGELKI